MILKCCSRLFFATLLSALPAAIYAQNDFLYTNNGPSVFGFSAAANGTLSPIPGSPFITGGEARFGSGIAISPTSNFLYVSNGVAKIDVFSIDPQTGVIVSISGSPFETGSGQIGGLSLAITPDGKFLYAANPTTSLIVGFSVNVNGSLTPLPGFPVQTHSPVGLKMSPNGDFLFVSENFSAAVRVYSVASSGGLTLLYFSLLHADCDNVALAINCAGDLLFAGTDCGEFFVFNVAPNGSLMPVSGSPFNSQVLLHRILLNSRGNLLFLTDMRLARILVFGVNPSGVVSPMPLSSVSIADPNDEDSRPTDLALNQTETLLYVNSSANDTTFVFHVSPTGVLTQAMGSPVFGGSGDSIVSYPQKSCRFTADTCIQDDSTGIVLQINSSTGEYRFSNCAGLMLSGSGTVVRKGSALTLQHSDSDRRLTAKIDTASKKATASIQLLASGTNFVITDRNTVNNTCSCAPH